MIRKKFNLDVFNMGALVEEAIEYANQYDSSIMPQPKDEKKNLESVEGVDELSDMVMSEDED